MKNTNNELATKKELQQGFNELKQDVKELKTLMKEGFRALDKKTDIIEEKLDRVITWSKERAKEVLTW